MGKLDHVQYDNNMSVSNVEISQIIAKLKCGKSSGPDGLSAEYLKFAHNKVCTMLALCFSACIVHGYLPASMIETTIVPIIKNKCGDLSDSNNYRPIALATIMSKVFESVLLFKCEKYLHTCDNQFGFKSEHSTDLCIYTLREFIDFYKKRNTTVFVTFMDASKAFDRIDHWLLFDKLLARKIPLFIIRIFIFWYSQQSMCIRWGNTLSASFKVTNGVKQGGILSPTLFNVYMDNLSILLNSSNIGGRIGDQLINHLCYADDLCLISLSSAGMQQLLHICNQYAADHHLLYNGLKSFSMCFKPKTIKFNQPEFYLENRIIPSVTQCKYLGIMIDVKKL